MLLTLRLEHPRSTLKAFREGDISALGSLSLLSGPSFERNEEIRGIFNIAYILLMFKIIE